ncbi:MAG: twin-arginine translocation signal domain-containing protein, partial [Proteobacteria bacterium]|nr:twin-arginine translocation signal domain-containing protein [Pseudomonadota bacterium]
MSKNNSKVISRRGFLQGSAMAIGATTVGGLMPTSFAIG